MKKKLRVLTKDDLGKCVEDIDVVTQPLYVVNDVVEYDDVDDLLWNIPQSDC